MTERTNANANVGSNGRVELILGPMFAGKSTELLRRVTRHELSGRACVLVKPRKDDRFGPQPRIVTHGSQTAEAVLCDTLQSVAPRLLEADVIGIDEGQFLLPGVLGFCERAAACGHIVIVAALDGTFERKPFGRVLELVPLAETVTKLLAVCGGCGRDAAFSERLVKNDRLELVGGAQEYRAVCRQCHRLPGASTTVATEDGQDDETPTATATDTH